MSTNVDEATPTLNVSEAAAEPAPARMPVHQRLLGRMRNGIEFIDGWDKGTVQRELAARMIAQQEAQRNSDQGLGGR